MKTYLLVAIPFATYLCVSSFLIDDRMQKVTTNVGEIAGFVEEVTFGGRTYQIRKFLGVPYAEPPVGVLRFSKPVMKTNLRSPFPARQFRAICPQPLNDRFTMSEDCLFLNIFTPDASGLSSSATKPVMIWIHGGGFVTGSSNLYDPSVLSAIGDVIVVTINYRIGILGFFSTHDQIAPGNFGLWDQQMAIRWVRENIGAFGGDVSNMTIFGESAGSSSVIYQMLYPGNKGLFHRAIAQSGTISGWAVTHGHTNYESSRDISRILGCNNTDSAALLSCLRQTPEKNMIDLIVKYERVINEVNRSWVPIFDNEFILGKTADILKELTNETVREKKYANFQNIDLLIGADSLDGAVYLPQMMFLLNNTTPTSIIFRVTADQMKEVVISRALEAWLGEIPSDLTKAITVQEYTDWNEPENGTRRLQNLVQIFTDSLLYAPTISTVNAHANLTSKTYLYHFSATPLLHLLPIPPEVDGENIVNHGDEIEYVFGFPKSLEALQTGLNITPEMVPPKHVELTKVMITMWTNFAKSGNPNLPVDVKLAHNITWPAYDTQGQKYLEITHEHSPESVKRRLAARSVQFWNKLLPAVQAFAKSRNSY